MALHESQVPSGDDDPLDRIRRNVETLMALRQIRSIEALALAAGIPKTRLYDRFNGSSPEWKATELAAVAKALRANPGDLFEDPDSLYDPGSRTGSNRNLTLVSVEPDPELAEDVVPPALRLVRSGS